MTTAVARVMTWVMASLQVSISPPDDDECGECCGNDVVPLVWDHDHISMEHRGWLCHNCNTAIGKLGDNLEGVLNAATYLAKAYKI